MPEYEFKPAAAILPEKGRQRIVELAAEVRSEVIVYATAYVRELLKRDYITSAVAGAQAKMLYVGSSSQPDLEQPSQSQLALTFAKKADDGRRLTVHVPVISFEAIDSLSFSEIDNLSLLPIVFIQRTELAEDGSLRGNGFSISHQGVRRFSLDHSAPEGIALHEESSLPLLEPAGNDRLLTAELMQLYEDLADWPEMHQIIVDADGTTRHI